MVSLTDIFGNSAQVKVLEFLLRNLGDTMMISDVAKGAGVANSTTARVIEPLLNSGIARETRIGKQIRIIRLNKEDERAKLLLRFVENLRNLEDRASSPESERTTASEKELKTNRRR